MVSMNTAAGRTAAAAAGNNSGQIVAGMEKQSVWFCAPVESCFVYNASHDQDDCPQGQAMP